MILLLVYDHTNQRRDPVMEVTDVIRIPEVAELTGIPENTLRYWRHQGIGPRSAKFGKRIVYRRSDVEAWIEEQFAKDAS